MEKSKIYTRKGDEGYTSLVGGKRVLKTNSRIEAYGTLDELNSFIACLLEEVDNREDREFLLRIQYNLFSLGGYLATENEDKSCRIAQKEVDLLEEEIDKIDSLIPPLKFFVLPGGCESSARAHVCRTVCRRAERRIYSLMEQVEIDPVALKYINRLSDYFFLFSRKQNFIHNIDEIIWENPCK
ncbi:MAG: cob(I)yrinic acid a,c-diamide adenosyltransferase [Dysgonamonadaceae bacterium]|jgi:cob(I)alamin adenosyltransferase|nr:cob(I)yrinic acid a,c-diamide adenosyltransferase [Dysgonamonadaceae bacterium]